MTSPSHLSARLDAIVERLTSCSVPTPTALALEAAAELLAVDAASSKKGARNKVLTELFWVGKNGKELSPEGKKRAIKDLKESGAVHETKGGKLKLTKQGVQDFAAISKKKAELVEKGVRRFASMDDAKQAIRASLQTTLAIQANERMASPMTPPIYDQVFADGLEALDAALVDEIADSLGTAARDHAAHKAKRGALLEKQPDGTVVKHRGKQYTKQTIDKYGFWSPAKGHTLTSIQLATELGTKLDKLFKASVIDTETLRVLATLERGDVVKIGSSKWAVYRKLDDMNVWAYKWPSKKTKVYTIRPDENPEAPGEEVVVFEAGGSGQRLGADVAKGKLTNSSVQRKGADMDASLSAAGNRDSAVVVTIPIPEKYAKRFPDAVTANHGHAPHMTLLFVGTKDYQPGEMSQILTTLRAACQKVPPFRLYVDPNAGLQDFGPNEEKGEKALWLPARAEPRGEAERLHRVMRMALEQEGIEVGAHDSFKPHVTWAYVPNDQPEQERNRMNAAVSDRFKEGFYFDVRHIMLSTPDGAPKVLALSPLPRKK